jgi:hypothetical protein
MESTVTRNDGETAEFSDGGKVVRQRPTCNTAVAVDYVTPLSWDTFKCVFEVGLSKAQVNWRLKNPETSDGEPIGSNIPINKPGTSRFRVG